MYRIALSIFSLFLLSFTAQAQAPQAFKYQAVVRDAAGQVLANTPVTLYTDLEQNGTAVYQEDHAGTTNAFGLINLEIGRGTVVSGDFSAIDWSIPTFVHIYLNGASMGTSELLSVPYALYAANAGGGGGLPANAQTGDIVYYDGTAWQRPPAGAAGTVLTMGTDGKPFWQAPSQLDSLIKVTMTNGDVIYTYPIDNSPSVIWGPLGTNITALTDITTAAAANMDFNGEANTAAIVAQLGTNGGTPYAAKLCADLVAYGFDDWYLPAAGELNEIYLKLGASGSGQITTGIYWSSSEDSDSFAWNQDFDDGLLLANVKVNNFVQCRCVRR